MSAGDGTTHYPVGTPRNFVAGGPSLGALCETFVARVFEIVVEDVACNYVDSFVVIFEWSLTVLTSLIFWVPELVHD